MKLIRSMLAILIGAVLVSSPAWAAPNQGVFTSVSGQVQIKAKSGQKTRVAQKDSTVVEGESIVTDKNSKATLQLFDGSKLDISPGTNFQLAKLQKPSVQDKVMQFKLFVGKLFASVKKLASSKSSFEIEAGGVVCGVRGTQFSLDYNPGQSKVDLSVIEGTVYANSGGNSNVFTAGQNQEFINGNPTGNPNGNNSNPNTGGKNQGKNNITEPVVLDVSLGDLNNQFGQGLAVNGDNNFTNPNVAGSIHITVRADVPAAENVP